VTSGSLPAVVHVMGWGSQQYGSFERFLVELSRQCLAAGIATHLVFQGRPSSDAFVADVQADVHSLSSPRGPADPRLVLGLRRLFRKVGATHLHAHYGLDAYHAVAAARWFGVSRRFATKHITPGFSRLTASRTRHRWLARSVERLFAVSAIVADDLYALGVPRRKVEVSYLGVDAATYRPDPGARAAVREELGLPPATRIVLSTSHLRPGKGVEVLPRLAAELNRDPGGSCLAAAGGGPLASELEREARTLGLDADSFRLLGVREDVPRLLAASDLYVFPTTGAEGLPLAPLEALAAGVPVVGTAVSELTRLVGGVAQLVPPGRPDALVSACRAALLDPDAAERSVMARALVSQQLSVERSVQRHLEHYTA
jgi:glycosyltransferase involved in cell wall biosynthesis